MGIDLEDAVVTAVERTATRAGATLACCTFLVQLLSAVGFDTERAFLQRRLRRGLADALETTPATLLDGGQLAVSRGALGLSEAVPHWVGAVLALAAAVLGIAVTVVGLRTFSGSFTEAVPRTAVAGLPTRTAHAVVGSVLFTVLVAGGLVLFVLPGVVLALGLYFVTAAIAIEGDDVLAGLRRSWSLTAGNRLDAFLFVLVLAAVAVAASITATAVSSLLAQSADQTDLVMRVATISPLARVAGVGVTSIATVFTVALTAAVFDQFRATAAGQGPADDLADVDPELLP
ncbi:hypothetical protein [Haloarchaeobius amylolyticus]|uniref:hypothetical protein n=1 Tax=Haloarchaeobius amylolyticus TaxID=1198296 RepID=UPI00226FEE93|nr:hypothetical protein [Haloarchaeobius amylolyticus]